MYIPRGNSCVLYCIALSDPDPDPDKSSRPVMQEIQTSNLIKQDIPVPFCQRVQRRQRNAGVNKILNGQFVIGNPMPGALRN